MTLLRAAATSGNWVDWAGGGGMLLAAGSFNGSTLRIEFQDNEGETVVADALTSSGCTWIEMPSAMGRVRAVLSGGYPSGIWATLVS